MALSWLKYPRARFTSICERIRDWLLAPLRAHLTHFENRQIDRLQEIKALWDNVQVLTSDFRYDNSMRLGGLDERLEKLEALHELYQDVNHKLASIQACLYGGTAQDWLKKQARGPREFNYEDRQ